MDRHKKSKGRKIEFSLFYLSGLGEYFCLTFKAGESEKVLKIEFSQIVIGHINQHNLNFLRIGIISCLL